MTGGMDDPIEPMDLANTKERANMNEHGAACYSSARH